MTHYLDYHILSCTIQPVNWFAQHFSTIISLFPGTSKSKKLSFGSLSWPLISRFPTKTLLLHYGKCFSNSQPFSRERKLNTSSHLFSIAIKTRYTFNIIIFTQRANQIRRDVWMQFLAAMWTTSMCSCDNMMFKWSMISSLFLFLFFKSRRSKKKISSLFNNNIQNSSIFLILKKHTS